MKIFFLLALALCAQAFASERIENYKVFNNRMQLDGDIRDVKLIDIFVTNVPSKVKIIEDEFCGAEEISCTQRIVLERTPAIRVLVSYYKPGSMDTDGEQREDLFFPVSTLDAETIAKIKGNTTTFDLLGRRGKVRRAILKANFAATVTSRQVQISVIDYQRSTLCSMDDGPWCEEELFYLPKMITVKDVVVNKK